MVVLAYVIAVNTAEGDFAPAAPGAAADLRHAAHLLRPKRPGWDVTVTTCSALTGVGMPELWEAIGALHERLQHEGLDELRAHQSTAWMWSEVTDTLLDRLRDHAAVRRLVPSLETAVAAGEVAPAVAAQQLLAAFLGPDGQG